MARGEVSGIIPAPAEAVFDLVHDYAKRLEWDTLLRAAYLDDGHTVACKGATSVCIGKRTNGGIAIKTVYVSFDRPRVAAVKMLNSPPIFATWAASIRHVDLGDGTSRMTYKYSFTTRHVWRLAEPLVERAFRWETAKRLAALAAHFAKR